MENNCKDCPSLADDLIKSNQKIERLKKIIECLYTVSALALADDKKNILEDEDVMLEICCISAVAIGMREIEKFNLGNIVALANDDKLKEYLGVDKDIKEEITNFVENKIMKKV